MTHHFRSLPPIAAVVAVLALFAPSLSIAQTATANPAAGTAAQAGLLSTSAFARLIEGKQVIVTTVDGLQYVGILTVSGNALVASGSKLNTTIPFDQVARVQKDSFRIRHDWMIGLGVGAAVGVAVRVAEGEGGVVGILLLIGNYGGIGAAIGAGVGGILNKIHSGDDVIYDSRRRTTTMALAPIVSPTRKGVAFTMTWR